jgi:hypothetical protein
MCKINRGVLAAQFEVGRQVRIGGLEPTMTITRHITSKSVEVASRNSDGTLSHSCVSTAVLVPPPFLDRPLYRR